MALARLTAVGSASAGTAAAAILAWNTVGPSTGADSGDDLERDPDTGRYRLKFLGSGGGTVAGIGEERDLGGGLGKGYVTISNDRGTSVAVLTAGERTGGPHHFKPGLGLFGLPGSCLSGKR